MRKPMNCSSFTRGAGCSNRCSAGYRFVLWITLLFPMHHVRSMFRLREQADVLIVESNGDLGFPPRYLNPDGQFRLGAPFCERDLHGPASLQPIDDLSECTVRIKDGEQWTRYTLANHPFDVVGWEGQVYRLRLMRTTSSPSREPFISRRPSIRLFKPVVSCVYVCPPDARHPSARHQSSLRS